MGQDLMRTYVGDHLLGAAAGLELFRRAAAAQRGTAADAALHRLTAEVAEDREALRAVARRLGVPARGAREAAGWLAEKAGRVKPNGRIVRRSPLSDLVELEALELGVRGKAAGWRSLRTVAEGHPALDPAELDRLVERADRQAAELSGLREAAAARVLRPQPA